MLQRPALGLEAPIAAAAMAEETLTNRMSRLAIYRKSESTSIRAEFRKACRDSIKWRRRWFTEIGDAPPGVTPLTWEDVKRLARDGRSYIMNKDGVCKSWRPSHRTAVVREDAYLETPFAAWACMVGQVVDEVYDQNAQMELLAPGAVPTPVFDDILDTFMIGMYGSKTPSKADADRMVEYQAARVTRGEGIAKRVALRKEADVMQKAIEQQAKAFPAKVAAKAGQPAGAVTQYGGSSGSGAPAPAAAAAPAAFAVPAPQGPPERRGIVRPADPATPPAVRRRPAVSPKGASPATSATSTPDYRRGRYDRPAHGRGASP